MSRIARPSRSQFVVSEMLTVAKERLPGVRRRSQIAVLARRSVRAQVRSFRARPLPGNEPGACSYLPPMVSAITALAVCSLFSASS